MIELTENDFYYNRNTDILEIDLTADLNITGEEFYTSVRKQIFEWKEKAAKWDNIHDESMKNLNKIIYEQLQENKHLQSDLKDYKDAATAEADQVDLLQKQNKELKEIIEKIRYRINQFRIKDGMIQDNFAYDALRKLLATSEGN